MSAWPPDYHMHTKLCRHATGEPRDLAAQALKRGLREIGISEHAPMPPNRSDDWHMLESELESYVEMVLTAQQQFPQLQIKLGLEVDYLPGSEEWIRTLAKRLPWDYFIGSVHYLSDSWVMDNPATISEWEKRDVLEVWTIYFDLLRQAAQSGLFDIIGHADLCKKFGYYPKANCRPLYESFIASLKAAGVALELNTAGLRKPCREIYPSAEIVQLAAQAGVPITFGSDAHDPAEVGADFDKAITLAKQQGYTSSCRFTRRRREVVPW